MAYIANTAFEARITNKQYDDTLNITGVFQESAADAICSAGFLCKTSTHYTNQGYSTQSYVNENAYIMIEAESTELVNTPIYACNTFDVNYIVDSVTGNSYAVGANTLGLPAPAGRHTAFTQIQFDGKSKYRFGIGNLSAAIETKTFFTIANGLLVPATSAPSANGTPYFKLEGTGTFTVGNQVGFTYYDVTACVAVA
jgi:hypothetical protein